MANMFLKKYGQTNIRISGIYAYLRVSYWQIYPKKRDQSSTAKRPGKEYLLAIAQIPTNISKYGHLKPSKLSL